MFELGLNEWISSEQSEKDTLDRRKITHKDRAGNNIVCSLWQKQIEVESGRC